MNILGVPSNSKATITSLVVRLLLLGDYHSVNLTTAHLLDFAPPLPRNAFAIRDIANATARLSMVLNVLLLIGESFIPLMF